jgi:hypothetical protein
MNYLSRFLAFLLLAFLYQNANSQFTISGEYRPKVMLMDGYKQLRDESKFPYGVVIQRSRLNFDYTKENITFIFSVQDIRVWGQDALSANNNSVGIFEAYLKYGFCKQLAIKFGRQQIRYDDERIMSFINWRDQGATHDIAILQFNKEEHLFKADIGLAMNNHSTYQNYLTEYSVSGYKYMAYLWLNKKFQNKKLETSIFGISDVNQTPSTINNYRTRYTIGPYINYKNTNLSLTTSLYFQTGKIANGKDVDALFYSIKTSYKLHKMIELGAGYDYYSGTDFSDTTKANTKSTTFDKLFGTNHTFLGFMDYFSGNASDVTKGAGINDFYVKANFILSEKHNIEAIYHLFNLDKQYFLVSKKASIKYDKALGSEIDLIYTYKQSKALNFSLGYSFLLPSETMENLQGYNKNESKFAHFAYMLVTFKPTFLTHNEK